MTTTRKKILAGNWKMNMNQAEVNSFGLEAKELGSIAKAASADGVEIVVGAPYTSLGACKVSLTPINIRIAAQNAHFESSGAYTGEISFEMLSELGITSVIVGHSERRQYFNETDKTVQMKVAKGLSAGFQIIACVGESLEERESNLTSKVLARQIKAIAEGARGQANNLVVAYEPIWAIGTGKTATPEMAESAHAEIRKLLASELDEATAEQVPLLYGGSAKPSNFPGLISQKNIDGALVGGASLKASDFSTMAEQII